MFNYSLKQPKNWSIKLTLSFFKFNITDIRNILKEKILYWLLIANYRKSLYVENSWNPKTKEILGIFTKLYF